MYLWLKFSRTLKLSLLHRNMPSGYSNRVHSWAFSCCNILFLARADNWLVDTGSEPSQHDGLSPFGKVSGANRSRQIMLSESNMLQSSLKNNACRYSTFHCLCNYFLAVVIVKECICVCTLFILCDNSSHKKYWVTIFFLLIGLFGFTVLKSRMETIILHIVEYLCWKRVSYRDLICQTPILWNNMNINTSLARSDVRSAVSRHNSGLGWMELNSNRRVIIREAHDAEPDLLMQSHLLYHRFNVFLDDDEQKKTLLIHEVCQLLNMTWKKQIIWMLSQQKV